MFSGQSQPRLQILPANENVVVFLDSGYSMACEIVGLGPQVVDVELRWFNPHGVELVEVSGQDRLLFFDFESFMYKRLS